MEGQERERRGRRRRRRRWKRRFFHLMEQHPSITRSGKIAGSENLSKRFSEFVETFAVTARPRTPRMRPNRNSLRKRDGKKEETKKKKKKKKQKKKEKPRRTIRE